MFRTIYAGLKLSLHGVKAASAAASATARAVSIDRRASDDVINLFWRDSPFSTCSNPFDDYRSAAILPLHARHVA